MNNKVTQSQAGLRRRKMMLALPILVIPFLTLAFWAMGGGKAGAATRTETKNWNGLNLHLPDPKLKRETPLDKLGFYDEADKDSLKLREQERNDPFYQQQVQNVNESGSFNELKQMAQNSAGKFHQSSLTEKALNPSAYHTDANEAEEKLVQKLAELNKTMNQQQTHSVNNDEDPYSNNLESNPKLNTNVESLERMMQTMNPSKDSDSDPELEKLSSMMDKIIDIQHPERIRQKLSEKTAKQTNNIFTVIDNSASDTGFNGFYSLENETTIKTSNAIEAVVNEDQTLVNGAVIKLRLLDDIFISGSKISAGTFVFGIVSLNGERLEIEINSIRNESSLYPVKMEAFDLDGLSGIYIPGAISREVVKQSADNSLQTMQLTSLDPSLAAQATAAGISTIKKLLSKKVKLTKVFVKAGYKLLLKNKAVNNN